MMHTQKEHTADSLQAPQLGHSCDQPPYDSIRIGGPLIMPTQLFKQPMGTQT